MSSLRDTTFGVYVENVSSSSPTPGGGSVTAAVGALAASLGAMVAEITTAQTPDPSLVTWKTSCRSHRERLLELCVEDEDAFRAVMACLRLPKDNPTRAPRLQSCLKTAATVPLETARVCLDVLRTLEPMTSRASRHSVSDVGVAAHLALAAVRASQLTIEVNRVSITDERTATELADDADHIEADAAAACHRIADQVLRRIRR